MIQDRIPKIEAPLANAADLPPATREELLAPLADLKTQVAPRAPTHAAEGQSIPRSADAAISRAAQTQPEPAAIQDFRASVQGFEASHPRLVQVVDQIALALSNMGI